MHMKLFLIPLFLENKESFDNENASKNRLHRRWSQELPLLQKEEIKGKIKFAFERTPLKIVCSFFWSAKTTTEKERYFLNYRQRYHRNVTQPLLRPRPHESGNRIFYSKNQPVNLLIETLSFWSRSPLWIFFGSDGLNKFVKMTETVYFFKSSTKS